MQGNGCQTCLDNSRVVAIPRQGQCARAFPAILFHVSLALRSRLINQAQRVRQPGSKMYLLAPAVKHRVFNECSDLPPRRPNGLLMQCCNAEDDKYVVAARAGNYTGCCHLAFTLTVLRI